MAVGSDVDIGSAYEAGHFLRGRKSVIEDYVRGHSHFLRQTLQAGSIFISLATKDVGVRRAGDDVHDVLVSGQNLG